MMFEKDWKVDFYVVNCCPNNKVSKKFRNIAHFSVLDSHEPHSLTWAAVLMESPDVGGPSDKFA